MWAGIHPSEETAGVSTKTSDPRDGMHWVPSSAATQPVVGPGELAFASVFFEHGHIYGQTNGLQGAGGTCKWAWDPDPAKIGGRITS